MYHVARVEADSESAARQCVIDGAFDSEESESSIDHGSMEIMDMDPADEEETP